MADQTEYDDLTLTEQVEEYDRVFGIVADGLVGAAGGLVGTAMLTGVLFVGVQIGAFDPTAFGFVTLGLVEVGSPVLLGYVIFLLNGMVPWPLLFASLMEYLPGERPPVSGAFFGVALWTGFVLGFYSGQTGMMLALYALITLAGHVVYGVGLGLVVEYLSSRPESLV